MMRMGESYASNLSRSQVSGAQEVRVSLQQDGSDPAGANTALSVAETRRDVSQGPIAESSSPTDLALNGPGYFLLFNDSGNLFMTRNGNFNFNSNGELVNSQGLFVASFDPNSNMINKTTKQTVSGSWGNEDHIAFNSDGTLVNLSRGNTAGRQLAIATVPNEQGMTASPSYAGVFTASESTGLLSTARAGENGLGTFVPQALEQSNISGTEQLINMASFQGGFKATAAAMKALTTALDDVIAQFKPA
jgi:flagellar hook protein FlgE